MHSLKIPRTLTTAAACGWLVVSTLGACSSPANSSGTPVADAVASQDAPTATDAGTDKPLPVVQVPQAGSMAELVPMFHESLGTLHKAHQDYFAAYQALASAQPGGDATTFDQASAAFGAASEALVKAALTANGYSTQFPALQKDGPPPDAVAPQAVIDIHKLGNGYIDRKAALYNMLQSQQITQAQYDTLLAQAWGEWKANAFGGLVGGAAMTGTFIVVGGKAAIATGAVASIAGPALVAVAVGVAVKVTVTWCFTPSTPPPTKAFAHKSGGLGEACYFATLTGKVGDTLAVPAGAQVMIEVQGHAPLYLDPATLKNGSVVLVDAQLGDPATGTPNGPPIVTPIDPGTFGTCEKVVSINAVTEPADPGPGQTVLVHATSVPPVAGCTMQFSIHGTDNYSKSEDVTTDAGGTGSFSIPGGAAGVVDTVTVGIGGHVSTLVYTF
jgi:hypothetical protein